MSKISFKDLIPHGNVIANTHDDVLELTTQSSITSIAYNLVGNSYKRHYLELPQKAHIPFRLTMQLKLDYTGMILLIGDGHVLFNCPSGHPLEDIVKPSGKPFLDGHQFDNHLPLDTFVTVTISYGMNEMQILVDGREAFYTKKQPYMKAKELQGLNEAGFRIGFEVAKLSKLLVKEIELEKLSQEEKFSRPEPYHSIVKLKAEEKANLTAGKSGFEGFLLNFSEALQRELIDTDTSLKALKNMKFKRSVDASGNKLTYMASDFGISYSIRCAEGEWCQSFSWYIVTAGKAETWHRKADYMEEVLQEINQTNPALAERIFNALNDCVGCYGARCIAKTLYSFQSKRKLACHGIVMLRLCHEDFQDVRDFFRHLSLMLERKAQEGTLQTDKIFMMK